MVVYRRQSLSEILEDGIIAQQGDLRGTAATEREWRAVNQISTSKHI